MRLDLNGRREEPLPHPRRWQQAKEKSPKNQACKNPEIVFAPIRSSGSKKYPQSAHQASDLQQSPRENRHQPEPPPPQHTVQPSSNQPPEGQTVKGKSDRPPVKQLKLLRMPGIWKCSRQRDKEFDEYPRHIDRRYALRFCLGDMFKHKRKVLFSRNIQIQITVRMVCPAGMIRPLQQPEIHETRRNKQRRCPVHQHQHRQEKRKRITR